MTLKAVKSDRCEQGNRTVEAPIRVDMEDQFRSANAVCAQSISSTSSPYIRAT